MVTFTNILKETDQLLRMVDEFHHVYLTNTVVKQVAPSIAIPATETKQGEQKIPSVKPNGITR
jgi:hypothetical protein